MELTGIAAEFEGAELGDRRREYRLTGIATSLARNPQASLPKALKNEASREAAYRLLRNRAVSADGILSGHYEQTVERAERHRVVLAIHDTTIFEFSGDAERADLGPLRGRGQGFLGHFTLLAGLGEQVVPLGVLSLQAVVRQARGRPKDKESDRWLKGVELSEQRLGNRKDVIHVMDREADDFGLLARLIEAGHRFVIRSSYDRSITDDFRISDVLANVKATVEREVTLSKRLKKNPGLTRKQPAREGRQARLAISGVSMILPRPASADSAQPDMISINIVQVREVDPPADSEPVHWKLFTTEPIARQADLERVVDCYRGRWLIEEYFKAIKTGCAYEKRQMESLKTLLNTLALVAPIAWRLLLLRTLARQTPDVPATRALTKTQLAILAKRRYGHLQPAATVRDAMLAIAQLGGHIKSNGDPGWIVLGRGFDDLVHLEEGWLAAKGDL